MTKPRITAAQLTDVQPVRQCAELAYQKYVSRMGRKPAPMCADFHQHIQNGECHIIRVNDRIVAYIVFRLLPTALFIENIAVNPSFSGLGMGKQLLHYAETQAQKAGLTQATLYTNEAMTENLAFYARLGWEEAERKEEDGFKRIYFVKHLSW